ncbi:MAG: hypothetical protein PHT60_07090 [Acidiphilium sp.]|nr:hypothetical protein [Acidiphilium sp.]MDD4935527.1 hypothetical protein [Acidiphilium sp.]
MNEDDQDFLREMAKSLDATLYELNAREEELLDVLGDERAEDLQSYYDRRLDPEEAEQFREMLDYDDRQMISVWNRLLRVKEQRLLVGRLLMRNIIIETVSGIKAASSDRPT